MEQPLPDEPKGWRKLCAMAQKERDPNPSVNYPRETIGKQSTS